MDADLNLMLVDAGVGLVRAVLTDSQLPSQRVRSIIAASAAELPRGAS
jgi:hypothetical protein